jgi:pimeloyl-ACP methyl ester carboxylesterase
MHGGGGVPKQINDSQWQHMQIYYKDHPEAGGYLYCALRAPTDEWNGFYTDYMYPLIDRLILQFGVCAEIDPDKVYAIGYSHGGYGAFSIGPKMPDRFAAVHASASAPNDGQTQALGLHSLKFSFMVGGKDTAYGRRTRCEAFETVLQGLKQQHPELYPTTFTLVENNGHTGLPDRDILPKLLAERRTVVAKQLFWQLSDGVIHDHYWLHTDRPEGGKRIDAALDGGTLKLSQCDLPTAEAWLDARVLDLRQGLVVVDGERKTEVRLEPSVRVLCATLQQRGDAQRAASCVVRLR